MPETATGASLGHAARVREFFDQQYAAHDRYWWRRGNRYSIQPADHTAFNAAWLAEAVQRGPGRALDLGAGEGADAIRLARLGYAVDAIEISPVACEKAERFAHAQGVAISVRNEPIEAATLTGPYDLVLMNGCLHYVCDKEHVLCAARAASAPDAVHAITLFSTATAVPAEHAVIPVFPDNEGGLVEGFYQDWRVLHRAYERNRPDRSHPGFPPHAHSHIKLIAQRIPAETEGH